MQVYPKRFNLSFIKLIKQSLGSFNTDLTQKYVALKKTHRGPGARAL